MLSYRPAENKDLPALLELEQLSFHDAWSETILEDTLKHPLATIYIQEAEGKVVGYFSFMSIVGEAQVLRVAVLPEERGKGYGRALSQFMVAKCWELGNEALTLEVREGNIPAQKAYLACGFKSTGIRPDYYPDNHENAVIMWVYKEGK